MSDILKFAVNFTKKNKTYPTLVDLAMAGYTRAKVREEYYSLEMLLQEVSKKVDDVIFDLSRHNVDTTPSKKKRFVITTAVVGANINKAFYKSIKTYCAKNDAELNVLISVNKSTGHQILPIELKDEKFVLTDTELNSNLFILGIRNSAAQADPITGLPRIGQRNGTFICPSPKQRLKYVATGPNKLPHAIMSTGAITTPNYIKSPLMVAKNAYMADNDHVMGAIVVELDKGGMFHFRQIECDEQGGFVDLGKYYNKNKISNMAPEAVVVGDWHSGDTDPTVISCLKQLTNQTNAKRWIMHDIFDGLSINPHIKGKNITRSKLAEALKLNLKKELERLKVDIKYIKSIVDEVIIVRSNHDDFLDRYLDNAHYVGDDTNHRLALELATHLIDGKNPLEEYVGELSGVTWLKLDESYKVADVECGMHGHLGSNGSRGSLAQMETAYGNVMFGHSHTPGILRDAWNVGTSTYLQLGYNHGASSWVQCSGLIYPNGQRQLINFINGKYTTKK